MLTKRVPLRFVLLAGVVVVAAAVGAAALFTHSSGSASSGSSSTSPASYGTVISLPVPSALRRLPLTNQHGRRVDLASWPGKTVVLAPFLTLCSDICPLTTGNLVQVERSLRDDHAASHVQIVEMTVDPHRDIPARLAAYAKLTGVHFQLVTESPKELAEFAEFFGFTYEKVPEDKPASIDWWTGKPLTYDIDHSDNYFVINPAGTERVEESASPDFHGHLNPKLNHFLDGLGHYHLQHPAEPDWTPKSLLTALGLMLHRNLPVNLG
jgi:protein SCO1/2